MEAKLSDVHIVVNATTTEMIDVEEYAQRYCQNGKALIVFNLSLDTLRGDLGQVLPNNMIFLIEVLTAIFHG